MDWNASSSGITPNINSVALYTSAWIEIPITTVRKSPISCRTLHECVDWNYSLVANIVVLKCRTLHECVDWNLSCGTIGTWRPSRTLHECVDWNILSTLLIDINLLSHSTRVRGLKYFYLLVETSLSRSHSTRVRGLKYRWLGAFESNDWSHSTRVRGLKCIQWAIRRQWWRVALYTSAWIEMNQQLEQEDC